MAASGTGFAAGTKPPGATSRPASPSSLGGNGRPGEMRREPAAGGGTTSVGPLTRATDDQQTGPAAEDEFTADTVSGSSATTASHPYEVPSGQTTAKPAAPVGNPVVPAGDTADDGPPPLRRRPDRPARAGDDRSAQPGPDDRPGPPESGRSGTGV